MRLIRLVLTAAMIVMILPWGAYLRAHAAMAAARPGISAVMDPAGARLSAPTTCRTAVQPGFGCVADPVIVQAGLIAAGDAAAAIWTGAVARFATGRHDPPPTAPPRAV